MAKSATAEAHDEAHDPNQKFGIRLRKARRYLLGKTLFLKGRVYAVSWELRLYLCEDHVDGKGEPWFEDAYVRQPRPVAVPISEARRAAQPVSRRVARGRARDEEPEDDEDLRYEDVSDEDVLGSDDTGLATGRVKPPKFAADEVQDATPAERRQPARRQPKAGGVVDLGGKGERGPARPGRASTQRARERRSARAEV